MLISRHIIYTDNPVVCERIEISFDPPVDVDSTLGKIESIYDDETLRGGNPIRRAVSAVINRNGLLHVKEVLRSGELLTIRLRPKHRLKDVVLNETNELQVLADQNRLQYWISAGKDGVLEVTGEMVKDEENFFSKLRKDLTDVPMRAYIAQETLLNRKEISKAVSVPDVLTTAEAADYLSLSTSKVYKLAQSGDLKRTPQKRFRKSDLDAYMQSRQKKKR